MIVSRYTPDYFQLSRLQVHRPKLLVGEVHFHHVSTFYFWRPMAIIYKLFLRLFDMHTFGLCATRLNQYISDYIWKRLFFNFSNSKLRQSPLAMFYSLHDGLVLWLIISQFCFRYKISYRVVHPYTSRN